MRWRCIKCRTTVERENPSLTAVYCCGCGVWRKPVRPVVRAVKRTRGWPESDNVTVKVTQITNGGRVTHVHVPGDCGHQAYRFPMLEQYLEQDFMFDEPGEAS